MKMKMRFVVSVIALAGFASQSPMEAQGRENGGAVFVMTNAAERNEIIAYERSPEGYLSDRHTVPTGGRGSGGNDRSAWVSRIVGAYGRSCLSPSRERRER